MGRKFELRTDHHGLKHLFGQPTLNSKQTRCLEFFSEYDFEIKHVKGKENQVVDALSRRDHETHIASIGMYMNDLKYKIIATTNLDQRYLKIKDDPGGYWWPPTYSNWLLLTVFSSTRSSVILCNCGFYTFGVV
jgi:hypothetical protein